jgi:hypothetical protein
LGSRTRSSAPALQFTRIRPLVQNKDGDVNNPKGKEHPVNKPGSMWQASAFHCASCNERAMRLKNVASSPEFFSLVLAVRSGYFSLQYKLECAFDVLQHIGSVSQRLHVLLSQGI